MANPWLKKNPFLSVWLSAINAAAGSIRGRAAATARREATKATARASDAFVDAWLGKPPRTSRKKQRKR